MTCESVRQQLPFYVDGVLPEPESGEVRRHLDECDACRRESEAIRDFERDLRRTLGSEPPPDKLWARIQESLATTRPMARAPSLLSGWRSVVAVVMVALVALTLTFLSPRYLAPEVSEAQLVRMPVDELRTYVASGRSLDIASGDPRTLAAWFADKVAFAPPIPPSPGESLILIGGRLCYLFNRRAASYMYEIDGRLVSLYVMPGRGLGVPGEARGNAEGRPVVVNTQDGFTHAIWSDADLLYSLVSDAPRERLMSLVAQMRSPPRLSL